MIDGKLISVLLPVYKNKLFVDESIESINNSSTCDIEIIAIVKNSGDSLFETISDKYSSNRIIVIKQTVGGLSDAINLGFERAKGHYIAFQDSDDISEQDRFDIEVGALEHHPEAELVFSKVRKIDRLGNTINIFGGINKGYKINNKVAFKELMIHGNYIPNPTVMMRRRHLLESYLFDPRIDYCVDYLHHLMLTSEWDIIEIEKPLVKYRSFPGHDSLSSHFEKNVMAVNWILNEIKYIGLNKKIISNKDFGLSKSNFYLFVSYGYYKRKKFDRAIYYIIESIKNSPFPISDIKYRLKMMAIGLKI